VIEILKIEDPEIAAIYERDWDISLWTNNTIETAFGFILLQQFFGENNYAFIVNYYDGKMYWKELECMKYNSGEQGNVLL